MAAKESSRTMKAARSAGRIGVVASVAMNLAWLAMYIRQRYGEITTVEASRGKPPVTQDSVVILDHGDPVMYEEFWRREGDSASILIPAWQTMSYFSNLGGICCFLEPGLEREVRRLHRLVGNAVVDGYHVIVGTGSTQLFQAVLYAISPASDGTPIDVVSPAPYYSCYPVAASFLNSGLYRWGGDANTFAGDDTSCVEVVCSPNNPDGGIRHAVVKSKSSKAIYDFAYYWPQYTPITEAAAHEVMLFTFSKCSGHAGTRLGWALVKDTEVAKKMTKFMELTTIGVSKDSQLRAAKILGAICNGYEQLPSAGQTRSHLFHFARDKMAARWTRLRAAVAASDIFTLPDELSEYCGFFKKTITANPAFAWLRCKKDGIEDLESFLRENKIVTRGGTKFGVDGRVVRVSMVDTDQAFNVFLDRLSTMK
ncbi:Tryptophan aminotransferase-related protein 2 [Zea mays]|uniref:Tryptophan aminotransferase-related protein 2 n=1 Tax=Zea mays TaxID=4577 RepID=A0A3L6FJK7_MAIZE|nr:Tryptophan aminotransferase-related protein 2 [Zea mays]